MPLPDRLEQAEKILIGPLKTSTVAPLLHQAEERRAEAPEISARLYANLAEQLEAAGFLGHANVLRRKQLDALMAAHLFDEAAGVAAQLAVNAIHVGEEDELQALKIHHPEAAVQGGGMAGFVGARAGRGRLSVVSIV